MASNRRALCVGINQFKKYPGVALHGCVNDANGMSSILQDFMGFGRADIIGLTDNQAIKANIRENRDSDHLTK